MMVEKLRGKFLPSDYQLSLFMQMQNLRQRLLTVKEYTKEFYKVGISSGQIQEIEEKVARYINGLRMEIQDEISMLSLKTVDEAYQMTLKDEEKLLRKQSARGKGIFRGKGSQGGRGGSIAPKTGASNNSRQETSPDGDAGGRISFSRGRGGKGQEREFKCCKCNKLGHKSYECLENEGTNQRNVIVALIEGEGTQVLEVKNTPER